MVPKMNKIKGLINEQQKLINKLSMEIVNLGRSITKPNLKNALKN
jgi:hypothetical protein